jgi:hypothetical protein
MADAPLKVGINATALLSSRTGIGEYVYHLCRECLAAEDVDPSFFYGVWASHLREQPLPNIEAIKTASRGFFPGPTLPSSWFVR